MQVLSILHAVHSLLVFFNILAPRLLVTNAGLVGSLSLIMLNSMNLAVACRHVHTLILAMEQGQAVSPLGQLSATLSSFSHRPLPYGAATELSCLCQNGR